MKIKDKNSKKQVDVFMQTPGRGYNYAPKSQWKWTCLTRDNHGCPDNLIFFFPKIKTSIFKLLLEGWVWMSWWEHT